MNHQQGVPWGKSMISLGQKNLGIDVPGAQWLSPYLMFVGGTRGREEPRSAGRPGAHGYPARPDQEGLCITPAGARPPAFRDHLVGHHSSRWSWTRGGFAISGTDWPWQNDPGHADGLCPGITGSTRRVHHVRPEVGGRSLQPVLVNDDGGWTARARGAGCCGHANRGSGKVSGLA